MPPLKAAPPSIPVSAKSQSPRSFLYTTLAQTHLGERAALIISTLISFGRLSARELAQKSRLPVSVVKTSLVSLVQLQCVLYWKADTATYYCFHEEGLDKLLYSGDIVSMIEGKYNDGVSAEIVQNVLSMGHLRVGDYLSTGDKKLQIEIQKKFSTLFQDGYLIPLRSIHFSPINDVWLRTMKIAKDSLPFSATISETKRLAEATKIAKDKLLELLETPKAMEVFVSHNALGKVINPDLPLTFNLARFQKSLRTESLVSFATARVGSLTSQVYKAILSHLEKLSPDIQHPFQKIPGLLTDPDDLRHFTYSREEKETAKWLTFNANDVMKQLPKTIDLRKSIVSAPISGKRPRVKEGKQAKRVKTEYGAAMPPATPQSEPYNLSENDDDEECVSQNGYVDTTVLVSASLVQSHLKLMSSNSVPFLLETTPGNFVIPFNKLTASLKQFTYDALLQGTLTENPASLRILRCIREFRLVEEKQLCAAALIKEKDFRSCVVPLMRLNIIEVQEVPRSVDRSAARAVYLYRFKSELTMELISNSLMYNIGQLLEGIQDMKRNNAILLDKANRDDVKGKEEELLLASELSELKNLQSSEVNSIALANRVRSLFDVLHVF
ncbi:hypothetical protein BABINDRAFT_161609 [Babjeviella inositovora NRRL Y-12698]|uniref:DNA-directed RNA polymerase III subunit RPC3 n=1 Tax=Babjeviella inositovora NRRL Y-12698 TaxID=984486 RepID=A0A1E3QQI3_9ASCO|nr:uncharacterized protein BABINDRAFT_161609 [Babjeviella inositovora NRRL Y-12698]ODQ79945.1 hypothetical protein BABINDRAFT_161609 [Babjeviella inositovora NRRL Y-12698]